MKTTLELPDDLLIEVKTAAARRKTTLRAIVEQALRRELSPAPEIANPDPEKYEVGPFGILSLKKREPGITAEQMQYLIDHQYDEEDTHVLAQLHKSP